MTPDNPAAKSTPGRPVNSRSTIYQDPSASISERVNDLLARMTLEEKIGQMTQVEKNSIDPQDVRRFNIGSILSGGGGYPAENTPAAWLTMVNRYLEAARGTRLGIPLIYGVDAVHGHNNLRGAVIFPHNIGLGATRDPELVRRIGRATALETCATGIRWNFAPTIAVPQDIRWGRTFEGYGERPDLVEALGPATIQGLQGDDLADPMSLLATPKHFAGDGGAAWGSSTTIFPPLAAAGITKPTPFFIDQGDTTLEESEFRPLHLSPYYAALKAGAQIVMASFSSWNGRKLHAHHYLLTQVLKGEMGFSGFVVSDWGGMDQINDDYYQAIVTGINAGIDMNMVPMQYRRFMSTMERAVEKGDIPLNRVDDAVRRILTVKMKAGLFDLPEIDDRYLSQIGLPEHRALAREAAAKSAVLLKNEGQLLPLLKGLPRILVAGRWADDIGLQCGGWTVEWQGGAGPMTTGTTLLAATRAATPGTVVEYSRNGRFPASDPEGEDSQAAQIGLVFVGEEPYAEGFGDRADLTLDEEIIALLERMRGLCQNVIVILVSGRPLIINRQLPLMDALVAAWLPGSEGQGLADVLFGDVPFSGRLPYTWPRTMDQIPLSKALEADPLFPYGFGLS